MDSETAWLETPWVLFLAPNRVAPAPGPMVQLPVYAVWVCPAEVRPFEESVDRPWQRHRGGCPGDRVMTIFGSYVWPRFSNIVYFEVYNSIWRVYGRYLRCMKVYGSIWRYRKVYKNLWAHFFDNVFFNFVGVQFLDIVFVQFFGRSTGLGRYLICL